MNNNLLTVKWYRICTYLHTTVNTIDYQFKSAQKLAQTMRGNVSQIIWFKCLRYHMFFFACGVQCHTSNYHCFAPVEDAWWHISTHFGVQVSFISSQSNWRSFTLLVVGEFAMKNDGKISLHKSTQTANLFNKQHIFHHRKTRRRRGFSNRQDREKQKSHHQRFHNFSFSTLLTCRQCELVRYAHTAALLFLLFAKIKPRRKKK